MTSPETIEAAFLSLGKLWHAGIAAEVSDFHLREGKVARLRKDGVMIPASDLGQDGAILPGLAQAVIGLSCNWVPQLSEPVVRRFETTGLVDRGFTFEGRRFRAHIYRALGVVCCTIRLIPAVLRPLDTLGLPPTYLEFLERSYGLIVVSGATGAGKSTTLTASIDYFNQREYLAIQTFEEPVEFEHVENKCTIFQNEVGEEGDVASFALAGRGVVRRDPDIIVFGELRDLTTIEQAMRAAGSGHLVFGTLHSSTATGAIEQILQSFPESDKEFFRVMLTQCLVGVVSQILVPAANGGRIGVYELLNNTLAVQNLIGQGKPAQLRGQMSSSTSAVAGGMQTRDQHLLKLVAQGLITDAVALAWAVEKTELSQKLRRK